MAWYDERKPDSKLGWTFPNRQALFETLASIPGFRNIWGYSAPVPATAERPIAERHEELRQGYKGNLEKVLIREYLDKLAGIGEQAAGRFIVMDTPKQIEDAALARRFPGMTRGVPLESLSRVYDKLSEYNANTARNTDAKPWSPRDFPDPGLAWAPRNLSRMLADEQALQNIGFGYK